MSAGAHALADPQDSKYPCFRVRNDSRRGNREDADWRFEVVTRRCPASSSRLELNVIPERFAVPNVNTAYILDFSDDDRSKKLTKAGKPTGLGAFLKAEFSTPEYLAKDILPTHPAPAAPPPQYPWYPPPMPPHDYGMPGPDPASPHTPAPHAAHYLVLPRLAAEDEVLELI
ncbi:hypothetical protein B0H13DRAFT_1875058 [Mycena leptocephala]|nr:hypothetical protein B0H13DRAFT_1875058 [Mycena leptocephala]